MKTTLIILAICALSIPVAAQNPDSRPSISVGLGGYASWGKYSQRSLGQDLNGKSLWLSVNTRIPVSQSATFWGGFGYDGQNSESDENYIFYGSETNWNALSFRLGMTFYFGKSINK